MSYDPGAPGDRSQPPGGYGGPGGPPPYGSGYGQQPPPGWGPPPGGPGGPPMGGPPGYGGPPGQFQEQGRNFFTGLLDFKFSGYFTSVMVPVVYALGALYFLVEMIQTVYGVFRIDAGYGILALIVGIISVAFFISLLKVFLEFVKATVESAGGPNRR